MKKAINQFFVPHKEKISTPKYIPVYECVKNHKDIKKLSRRAWDFIEFLMLYGYSEIDKAIFKIHREELLNKYNIKRGKLFRLINELKKVNIFFRYQNKHYIINLIGFYNKYFPEHFNKRILNNNE